MTTLLRPLGLFAVSAFLWPALLPAQEIPSTPVAGPDAVGATVSPGQGTQSADGPSLFSPESAPPRIRRQTGTSHPGPASSVHRWDSSDDGTGYLREHVVTTPRGERTQAWERSLTEEGYTYRREQGLIGPDGETLRQHTMTRSGVDPTHREWQHQMSQSLPGDRTLERSHTRIWDGDTRHMEHTFTGPNGQTRTFQKTWSADDTTATTTPPGPPGGRVRTGAAESGNPVAAGEAGRRTPRRGSFPEWLERLNPFRSREHASPGPGAAVHPRPQSTKRPSGFTLGSSAGQGWGTQRHGLAEPSPGNPRAAAARGRSIHHGPPAQAASRSRSARSR